MNYESRVMVQRRGKARDLTVCGLFSALIAVGAFIKIVIPVGADSMISPFSGFCAAGRTASGVKEGVLKCVHLSVDRAYGNPCFCTGRRTGVSAPSHLRLFTGVCAGSLCHGQKSVNGCTHPNQVPGYLRHRLGM